MYIVNFMDYSFTFQHIPIFGVNITFFSKYLKLILKNISAVLYSMPSYSLIIFGSSAVYSIGRDLSILKDYPEEQVKLIKEIEEANQYFKNN
jgi:hypothetical protein